MSAVEPGITGVGPGVVAVGPGVAAVGPGGGCSRTWGGCNRAWSVCNRSKSDCLELAPGMVAVESAPNVTAAATWVICVGHWAAGPQAIRNGPATVHE